MFDPVPAGCLPIGQAFEAIRGWVTSAYGAAGSLVVILLWVYYSSQILLFGAEFTRVYAEKYGSGVQPSPNAVPLSAEAQLRQGMPHSGDSRVMHHRESIQSSVLP